MKRERLNLIERHTEAPKKKAEKLQKCRGGGGGANICFGIMCTGWQDTCNGGRTGRGVE